MKQCRKQYTDNFRLEWWLYLAVLQFLPVDIAVEHVVFDVPIPTTTKSGIWCLRQQLYTTKYNPYH